ncbi:OmpA family protein [Flavobacterium sp.]|uniref:OmpA family protein n=1 Tax=Flavobacterium sp. TaxID=239 RepID=UPI0037532254
MKTKIIIYFLFFSLTVLGQEKLNVYFDFDKYELNEIAVKKINSWIAQGKNYQVTKLYGFCDWKGTNSYNDTLALKRVTEVYNFLKESEIDVKKDIEIRGFGEDFEQSKIQAENRRVTIIFQEKSESSAIEKETEAAKIPFKVKIKTAKKGDLIKLESIYFFNNSAKVVPKSEPILYELLCVMNDYPKLIIEIQGHICCKRPDQYDIISTARARTVYNYLIRNKVKRERMTFKGYGVSRPIHPIPEKNSQEEDDNRRVEILIIEN